MGSTSGDACCNHQVLGNNTTRRTVSQQVIVSILLNLGCCNSIQLFFYLFVYVMKACDEHCMFVSNQAYVFEEKGGGPGGCAAFLANNDQKNTATVAFRNLTFDLLPQLISILPDRGKIIFSSLFKISESGITETENDRDLSPVTIFVYFSYLRPQSDAFLAPIILTATANHFSRWPTTT